MIPGMCLSSLDKTPSLNVPISGDRPLPGSSILPVAPVAHQVVFEPGIGQFREFESPRVLTRINSWGLFLVHKLTCGKRDSVI